MNFDVRQLIIFAIIAYYNILFLYIILSLLQNMAGMRIPDAVRPAVNFTYDVSEPFLALFRRLIPGVNLGGMGLDLSPILAFLVIRFIVLPLASQLLGVG